MNLVATLILLEVVPTGHKWLRRGDVARGVSSIFFAGASESPNLMWNPGDSSSHGADHVHHRET